MATASPVPVPMPDSSVPVVMPDGKMNPDWYRFFKQWFDNYKIVRSEVP